MEEATDMHSNKSNTRLLKNPMASPKAGLPCAPEDLELIEKIIREAKEGSDFYISRQKTLKRNYEKIHELKHILSMATGPILLASRQKADEIISQKRLNNEKNRTWLHIDMDAFFCGVAQRNNPSLQNVPFVVGGRIVSSSNYIARQYGIRSGMPTFIAIKLLEEIQKIKGVESPIGLRIVKHNLSAQKQVGRQVREIIKKYSNSYFSFGDDEVSFDITEYLQKNYNTDEHSDYSEHKKYTIQIIKSIREEIFNITKLTASIGAGNNKMIAKIAADYNKPDSFHFVDNTVEFLKDLPVRKICGIGEFSALKLTELGIKTVGEMYEKRGAVYYLFKGAIGMGLILNSAGLVAQNHLKNKQLEINAFGRQSFSPEGKGSISKSKTFWKTSHPKVLETIAKKLVKGIYNEMNKAKVSFSGMTVGLQTAKMVKYYKSTVLKFKVDNESVFITHVLNNLNLLFRCIECNNDYKFEKVNEYNVNLTEKNELQLVIKKEKKFSAVIRFEEVRFLWIRIFHLKKTSFKLKQTSLDTFLKRCNPK